MIFFMFLQYSRGPNCPNASYINFFLLGDRVPLMGKYVTKYLDSHFKEKSIKQLVLNWWLQYNAYSNEYESMFKYYLSF